MGGNNKPDKRITIPCGYNEGYGYVTPGIKCFFYCSDWDKARDGARENGIPCNKNCLEWGRNWKTKKPKSKKMALKKHRAEIAGIKSVRGRLPRTLHMEAGRNHFPTLTYNITHFIVPVKGAKEDSMSSFLREFSGIGSRPYPLDHERRRRVLVALAERGMTVSDLARSLGVTRTCISEVINGRRLSQKTEQRIADFLGKPTDYLFPFRTPEEIGEMRQAEAAAKGKAA